MANGLRFSIGGIPVRIELTFFLVIALLGFAQPPVFIATWVALATVSVLLHELGHAVAFRSYGIRPSIVLHGFGGLTSGSGDLSPGRSIVVSLAGPLSALVLLGLPAWWVLTTAPSLSADAEVILGQMLWINVIWSLLNLVPVLPLDGGNVTASALELVTPRHGRRIAHVVSAVVAGLVAVWFLLSGLPFGGMLMALFVVTNVRELSAHKEVDDGEGLREAARALLAGQPDRAEALARGVLGRRRVGPSAAASARELVAWSRLAAGDVDAAAAMAGGFPAGQQPSASLRGALALAQANTTEGVAVLAWSQAHDQDGLWPTLGAVAAAQYGQVEALTRELLLLGPGAGPTAAEQFRRRLASTGHGAAAATVGRLAAGAAGGAPPAASGPPWMN
ncbi:MAG: hypothetical protein MUF83_05080 [Acidimicrobiales bacterium]|jgi:Zn-dependent protease|nr:hypothetical protein [Acidimicrobiales bacterium]